MELLRQQLVAGEEGIELVAFFESCASRHAMIVALLAVLELVRLQAILLIQEKQFGEIRLRKHKMFDVVFSGGESIGDSLREPLRGIDGQHQ
jgi:segregation and condensation protein A